MSLRAVNIYVINKPPGHWHFSMSMPWGLIYCINKPPGHWHFSKEGAIRGEIFGKSIPQVPDTGTWVLDNTRPFLLPSIVSSWIAPAHSKERKYHIFRQYWYTKNVPVFTNTGTFQYLRPEVNFYQIFSIKIVRKCKFQRILMQKSWIQ